MVSYGYSLCPRIEKCQDVTNECGTCMLYFWYKIICLIVATRPILEIHVIWFLIGSILCSGLLGLIENLCNFSATEHCSIIVSEPAYERVILEWALMAEIISILWMSELSVIKQPWNLSLLRDMRAIVFVIVRLVFRCTLKFLPRIIRGFLPITLNLVNI